ncbi:MAG: acylphosphatase [Herbinix sp.]|nr:acylphosphatase [Herbinix sp.]
MVPDDGGNHKEKYNNNGGFELRFINYLKKIRDNYVINQVKNIVLPDFNPSPRTRKRIIFKGRVQKVGFRLEINELANRLYLTGWVINRNDKNVEAEIQGETDKILFLLKYMKSLKRASVQEVLTNELPILDSETDFILIKE